MTYNTAIIAHSIVNDFAETARYLREVDRFVRETTDEFTINIIGDALGFLEKNVWFFTAYLEKVGYPNSQNHLILNHLCVLNERFSNMKGVRSYFDVRLYKVCTKIF